MLLKGELVKMVAASGLYVDYNPDHMTLISFFGNLDDYLNTLAFKD